MTPTRILGIILGIGLALILYGSWLIAHEQHEWLPTYQEYHKQHQAK